MRELHINGMTAPAMAIAIALEEKGLDVRIVERDWRETAEALAAFGQRELTNGLEGEFPILVDDGTALADSAFVLEYLDDRYATPPLRPADAYGQWRVQALARFLGERALPGIALLCIVAGEPADRAAAARLASSDLLTPERRSAWRDGFAEPAEHATLAEARRNATLLLDRVEALAAEDGEWLLGDQFTLSDIAAFALVHAWATAGGAEALDSHPAVRAWADRVAQRPSVARALALRPLAFLPGPELSRWG